MAHRIPGRVTPPERSAATVPGLRSRRRGRRPDSEAKAMALVYITALEHEDTAEIATELLGDGMPAERIHLYSTHPRQIPPSPVKVNRYRSPRSSVISGGAMGALLGALVGLPLLGLGALGAAPLLVLIVAGAAAGAVLRLWKGNGPGGELYRLDDALGRGETVMVLDVDDGGISAVESKVKSRHPGVAVLGTDPQGTPPFP